MAGDLWGIRFHCRCGRGEVWHTWAGLRWLRRKLKGHTGDFQPKVRTEPVPPAGHRNIYITWRVSPTILKELGIK